MATERDYEEKALWELDQQRHIDASLHDKAICITTGWGDPLYTHLSAEEGRLLARRINQLAEELEYTVSTSESELHIATVTRIAESQRVTGDFADDNDRVDA